MKNSLPLSAVRVVLLLAVVGCLSLFGSTSATAQTFAKGADTGWLQQMEANGYKFYNDQGVAQDCFALLKAKGINSIRLRVWVNPVMNDWVNGHCSPAEVVTMATRAKGMGFRIMIDFHYSDSWADPGKQTKPAAWAGHTFAQLLTDVYDHTHDVMAALAANGVYPEWVQVGNEIHSGMLWPEGQLSSTVSLNHPDQLAQLINQGYAAVKAVSSASKVVIHLDQGNNNSFFRSVFDQLRANSCNYDVIGMSYYPYWLSSTHPDYTASIGNLQTNLNDMVSRYGKEVVISEVGGDFTAPQNTYDMLVAVQQAVQAVPNGKGLGVFYWEPEGYKDFSGYQLSAWGNDGKPTIAMNAFLYNNLVTNPGFEANAAATQTPIGWTSWANTAGNYAADYTEAGGQSGSYRLSHWMATAYQASTYQIKTGLANGTYTLRAWVKSSGGQTANQLYAKNFGGVEKDYTLPVTNTWTQIQITDIQVTNGQAEIGLWSDAKAGNWTNLDNVEFFPAALPNAAMSPSPAAMVSFQADWQGTNQAVLRWTTASEVHSAYFAVERSTNECTFQEIGRVAAAGSSTQPHTYQLADTQALQLTAYYRLRQVDTNGLITYSPVAKLAPNAASAVWVSLYPNPSTGASPVRLTLHGLTARLVTVRIVDLLGRLVAEQQFQPIASPSESSVTVPGTTPAGVYLVTVSDGVQTWTTRWSREP